VPKKLLVEQGAPTSADKRVINDGIEELYWIAALKPTIIGVPEFRSDEREYQDISVLTAILDNTNTKLFMRCPDAETSAYVTEHFGVHKVLAPIMQPSGSITAREVEEDVLRISDILDLEQQEFYLMTYSGRFRGKIRDVRTSKLKIEFPEAPSGVKTPANGNESSEKKETAESEC